jgi:endonuclease/exonuclease/phosphatase (EEP) superfamily protein YafD
VRFHEDPQPAIHPKVVLRRLALILPAAVCAAWALLRLFGLERGFPLVGMLAFTPFAAALSLVVLLAAVLSRQRAVAVASALACVVLVGAVAPRALGGPSRADGPRLRVLTANLHVSGADPDAVVALARRADVLSVQEVGAGALAGLDGAGIRAVMPFRVAGLGRGSHGTALYSRTPLRRLAPPVGTWNTWTAASTTIAGREIQLVAVHPAAPFDGRRTRAWTTDYRKLPPATPEGTVRILAGDFNATLDHAALRRLIGTGYRDAADEVGAGLQPTFPVGHPIPPITLDHVLADRRVGVRAVTLSRLRGSDHRALTAVLVLPRAAP